MKLKKIFFFSISVHLQTNAVVSSHGFVERVSSCFDLEFFIDLKNDIYESSKKHCGDGTVQITSLSVVHQEAVDDEECIEELILE